LVKGGYSVEMVLKTIQRQRVRGNKHSGKNLWFANHHFDLDFQGPVDEWAKNQALLDLGWSDGFRGFAVTSGRKVDNSKNMIPWELEAATGWDLSSETKQGDICLGDEAHWPSLRSGFGANSKGTFNKTSDGLLALGAGEPSVRVVATRCLVEDDEWVCLSPKRLYRDALRAKQEVDSVLSRSSSISSSISSSVSFSKWLIVDGDDDMGSASRPGSPRFVEEEVEVTESTEDCSANNPLFFQED